MTKTEKILLILTAIFLAALFFLLPRPDRGVYRTEERFLAPAAAETSDESVVFVLETRIDLNTADEKELTKLPGIGKTLAARIVAYREEHGPFTCPEELLRVKGITDTTMEMLAERTVFPSGEK